MGEFTVHEMQRGSGSSDEEEESLEDDGEENLYENSQMLNEEDPNQMFDTVGKRKSSVFE